MSKYKLTSTRRGTVLLEEVELSNTRTAYVMNIPNTHSLTSARNNRKQKIPIEFLFSELHLNNVTSDAFFYGGHLVIMRSKRCAEQNQWITLRRALPTFELLTIG